MARKSRNIIGLGERDKGFLRRDAGIQCWRVSSFAPLARVVQNARSKSLATIPMQRNLFARRSRHFEGISFEIAEDSRTVGDAEDFFCSRLHG